MRTVTVRLLSEHARRMMRCGDSESMILFTYHRRSTVSELSSYDACPVTWVRWSETQAIGIGITHMQQTQSRELTGDLPVQPFIIARAAMWRQTGDWE